eukprot:TRINITY_DN2363_c0_g1_i10.p1 TRINITY_DN2363_c0_g1~~TRINITY_DN2363_c0_g1_i10.p1  ORF type:complete len:220 (-),score=9.73 TRINITY_DN2363_c0_g1_i10:575-1141(-)
MKNQLNIENEKFDKSIQSVIFFSYQKKNGNFSVWTTKQNTIVYNIVKTVHYIINYISSIFAIKEDIIFDKQIQIRISPFFRSYQNDNFDKYNWKSCIGCYFQSEIYFYLKEDQICRGIIIWLRNLFQGDFFFFFEDQFFVFFERKMDFKKEILVSIFIVDVAIEFVLSDRKLNVNFLLLIENLGKNFP